MNNLNAGKGVNTSTLAVVRKNALISFKATGRALTKVLGRPLSGKFNLKCGTLAGVIIGASMNPWTIPQTAVVGFAAGTLFSIFIDDPADKEKNRNEEYNLGGRIFASVVAIALFAAAYGLSSYASDFVYQRATDEGKAQRAAEIQQEKLEKEQAASKAAQQKAEKAKAIEDAWLAAQQGRGPVTIKLDDKNNISFKNLTATPKTVQNTDVCELSWLDPTQNDKPVKALILDRCSNIITQQKVSP